jgi:hypothetical protein
MCGAILRSWKEVLWIEPFNIAVEPVDLSSCNVTPTFPSGYLAILLTGRMVVITFTRNKCFGHVDLGWRGVQQGEKEKP